MFVWLFVCGGREMSRTGRRVGRQGYESHVCSIPDRYSSRRWVWLTMRVCVTCSRQTCWRRGDAVKGCGALGVFSRNGATAPLRRDGEVAHAALEHREDVPSALLEAGRSRSGIERSTPAGCRSQGLALPFSGAAVSRRTRGGRSCWGLGHPRGRCGWRTRWA